MKKRKIKLGQIVIITKKPNRPTNVEIGDIASECGFDGREHQFHSKDLVNMGKQRENYWVEFLLKDCYRLLDNEE